MVFQQEKAPFFFLLYLGRLTTNLHDILNKMRLLDKHSLLVVT